MINQYRLGQLSEANRNKILEQKGDKKVYISSDHGFWRPNAKGYTNKLEEAWVLTLREAYDNTKHCGPEKKVVFPYVVDIPIVETLSCSED